jgi:uncharacterized membrane protein
MASVTKSIVVNAPVEQVFAFWRNFENFPRFMKNIESISVVGPDTTHWKARGPLGTSVEWDAKTISVQENHKIAWQSTEGNIETHGAVTFGSEGAGTKVTVGIEYQPAGGALGEAVARMFSNPETMLEEDLNRFKQVAESGDFAAMSSSHAGAIGEGSYTNTVNSSQRDEAVTGSGSGADQNSETRSTS